MKKSITPCPFLSCAEESKRYGWIEITNRCNLKCPYCYADSTKNDKKELSFEKIKEVLLDFKKINAEVVMISGGEPTLMKEIVDILEFGSNLGLKMFLVSNGTILNSKIVKTLSAHKIPIQLSIDSIDPETYKKSRGVDLLPAVLKNIDLLIKSDVAISLASTLTKITKQSAKGLVEFAIKKGIQNIHIGEIIPEGRSKTNKNISILSPYSVYRELYNLQKKYFLFISIDLIENFLYPIIFNYKRKFYCNAMKGKTVEIGSDGQVYSCGGIRNLMIDMELNINSQPLFEIYKKINKVSKFFRVSVDEIPECRNCKYAYICAGGCRAIAYHHDNFKGKSPYCEDIKQIIDDIQLDLETGKLNDYKNFLLSGWFQNKKDGMSKIF